MQTITNGVERCRARVDSLTFDADTPGTFEAVASGEGSIALGAQGPTRFSSSAFDRSLARQAAYPLLWQHDDTKPIGVARMRYEEGVGLVAACVLSLDTQAGAEAHALLKAGAINGVSIGFSPVGVSPTRESYAGKPVRLVTEARLMELSCVTFPADATAVVRWVHGGAASFDGGLFAPRIDLAAAGRAESLYRREREMLARIRRGERP